MSFNQTKSEIYNAFLRESARSARLAAALRAIVKHADANGMRDWKVMKMARNALNDGQSEDATK